MKKKPQQEDFNYEDLKFLFKNGREHSTEYLMFPFAIHYGFADKSELKRRFRQWGMDKLLSTFYDVRERDHVIEYQKEGTIPVQFQKKEYMYSGKDAWGDIVDREGNHLLNYLVQWQLEEDLSDGEEQETIETYCDNVEQGVDEVTADEEEMMQKLVSAGSAIVTSDETIAIASGGAKDGAFDLPTE
jgi:hypothetical protein